MLASIIIVNYNTFKLTSDCIRSVLQFTDSANVEIILVDNASVECVPDKFLEEFPQIQIVRSAVNGGFAHGNNLGINVAKGEFILLLNSDTLLHEDSVTKTIGYLQSNPGLGIAGCRMIYPDGNVQYTARRFRSIAWELRDLFRFGLYFMSYRKRSRLMLGKYFLHDESLQCDWVNGAFFLFRKEILAKLPGGKLDERFFMYGEDQLWCEEVREIGYQTGFFAGTTITHINSGSTDIKKQVSLRKVMMKNELAIMQRRKGRGVYYRVFKFVFVSKETFRNIIKSIYFRLTGKLIR